ncbi:hypothetical protein [Sphingomonas sp.]|uniref:hypothetical protein n=1 Tax=Sphingomonas sp. TaxID=28214 RepID=UPI003D6D8E8A
MATQSEGSGTINAASTSVAVSFSLALDFAPNAADIRIAFTNIPTNDLGTISVTSVSTSGFTIKVKNAPGGTGVNFSWTVSAFP